MGDAAIASATFIPLPRTLANTVNGGLPTLLVLSRTEVLLVRLINHWLVALLESVPESAMATAPLVLGSEYSLPIAPRERIGLS
jgi:hypothetical protein